MEDLKKRLRQTGLSERAIEEILKWYIPRAADVD